MLWEGHRCFRTTAFGRGNLGDTLVGGEGRLKMKKPRNLNSGNGNRNTHDGSTKDTSKVESTGWEVDPHGAEDKFQEREKLRVS